MVLLGKDGLLTNIGEKVEGLCIVHVDGGFFYKKPGTTYWRPLPDVTCQVLLTLLGELDPIRVYDHSRHMIDSAYKAVDPPRSTYLKRVDAAYRQYRIEEQQFRDRQKKLRKASRNRKPN